ncbi:hypothetical protein D1007_26136 [Hordeum vulgare]|nr:hypothetical protein D1007_26136 [Hordeum vulgare]
MVDLAMAIVDPYYRGMKDVYKKKKKKKKKKVAWHRAWVRRLDEYHVKYAAKEAYISYEMCTWIINMRKCLHPAPTGNSRHKKLCYHVVVL